MNILFYIFSLLYYVSFVNITLYLMDAATITPGSGCPRCKGVDFQIKYIYIYNMMTSFIGV